MLPQSTVALTVSRNYPKVPYLKWSKSRIRSFFSSQPTCTTLMQEVTQLKQPSTVRKFPKDGSFVVWSETTVYVECLLTISISNVLPSSGCHFNWTWCCPHNNGTIAWRCMGVNNFLATCMMDTELVKASAWLSATALSYSILKVAGKTSCLWGLLTACNSAQ